MADLTGKIIADTYPGLLKTTDNAVIGASNKVITDGCGNNTALTLGKTGAQSTFDHNLVVDETFSAKGLTYPTSDGTANFPIVTDGSGTLSIGAIAAGAIPDLSPSPAATGKPSSLTVDAKGRVTSAKLFTPGLSAYPTPGTNNFVWPQGVAFVKFTLTGSGALGRNATGGAAGTIQGYLSGSEGQTWKIITAARQTSQNTSGLASCILSAAGASNIQVQANGGCYQFMGSTVCSTGIVHNNLGVTSSHIIPGGGGGVDTDGGGSEESEGGSSFWGSPPSYGAGSSHHAKSLVRQPGTGYAILEWS